MRIVRLETRHFKVGDNIYVYVTKTVSAIMYRTEVIKGDLYQEDIEDLSSYWLKEPNTPLKPIKYARLKLIEEYKENREQNARREICEYSAPVFFRIKRKTIYILKFCVYVTDSEVTNGCMSKVINFF